MVPAPGSTFTVRESTATTLNSGSPEELWLSPEPGRIASPMAACRNDQAFGYWVAIEDDLSKTHTTLTHTRSGSKARALDSTIVSSSLETDSHTSIWARSSRLLEELSSVIDAYLAEDPERARIVRHRLVAPPKLAASIVVDQGTGKVPFNWQFERRTLYLTETLIQLGQEACRWKEAEAQRTGLPFISLLPTSLNSEIRIVSRHRADGFRLKACSRIAKAAAIADADFYVTLGAQVLATIDSKPFCSPQNVGELVRTRHDPFQQQATGKVCDESEVLKALVQLCSQSLAAGCQDGLLAADWGRLLLPYRLEKSKTNRGEAQVVFSPTGSYCDVREGQQACATANDGSRAGLSGQVSPAFRLEQMPNSVFFLLGWILHVLEGLEEPAKSLQETEHSKPKTARSREEDQDERGPSEKHIRKRREDDIASTRRPEAKGSSGKLAHSGKDSTDSGTEGLPLVKSYVCTFGPILGGTFAGLHRCVVDRDHLEGHVARVPSHESKGRPAFGVLPELGANDCLALMKVQRVPLMPESGSSLPEPRFEEADDPPVSEEDREGIRKRTEQEIRIFQHCKHLQGILIPRLFGLVSPDEYPRSSSFKLMLQYLRAAPIGTLLQEQKDLWGREVCHAVEAAFEAFHAQRVYHGDASTANILIEWKQIASTSSGDPFAHAKTLEAWDLRPVIREAQARMQLSDRAFAAAARRTREHDETVGHSALALELTELPLSLLRAAVKPHVWLVDFADAVIVEDGREGDSLLASEARKVKQMVQRWASERIIGAL
ncbi:hypothetical protein BCV69DRAFT_300423 [Microstroma glucosiphilum]|uniref:Uncharacterized protein n=1 Tax=Pseudomicrostroma glucosiphilum TaxID=1684307 RepID=A0A316U111_9BASI|nr:hypothetical protein BCV69DRAFT_300423 [Pseudomicrostroma glucosiphilum]PWN19086.1 hypothetical protein BCV69DRAFT_300423 [Pseudomicrostroma glucosiphilum]